MDFFRRPAEEVAPELLGRYLVRSCGRSRMVVRLVEVEAYLGARDRASHAWGGRRTPRNESLYLAGGRAYVYFIYGMHYCLNAVVGDESNGEAVLLRAAAPISGITAMVEHRGVEGVPKAGQLTGGPAKLCQALQIDRQLDGVGLQRGAIRIVEGDPVPRERIVTGPRVGIDYAGEAAAWPLRFAARDEPHVSRPWPWKRRGSA